MNIDTELELTRLREALTIARLEIAGLKSEIKGDSMVDSWLQRKVVAQAKALARLNERVTNQRFTLRSIESLGRGLSSLELASAREREGKTVEAVNA